MKNKKLILSKENISIILFVILLISLIFLIQGTTILSQSSLIGNLTNVTLESNNLTHLNVSNSSIVLYMPFDENYNSTYTFDYTNNSNDGTLVGGTIINTTGCIYGNCYTFDAVDDYITVADSSSFNLGSYTLYAWVKMTLRGADTPRIISQQDAEYWVMRLDGGALTFCDNFELMILFFTRNSKFSSHLVNM